MPAAEGRSLSCARVVRRGLLLVLLAGCAVPSRPLSMTPHLPFSPGQDAARPDLSIGVAPFRDVRSALSRDPQRPPIRLAWLGLRRAGENSTGDGSFRGDVGESAQRDAARTLRYAQLFGEVRQVTSERVPEDLDFVLTGEIEELVGFQYQDTSFGLFGVAGYRSRLDPPIGTARLRFRLLGQDGELWSERIETRLQTNGLSMEQLALDALAATHERLVIALRRRLVGDGARADRTIPLRILDACGVGADRTRRMVEDVNEIFEREAGLRFQARVETWLAPPEADAANLLRQAAQMEPPVGGLTLAMAPTDRTVSPLLERSRSGLARQLGRHAVVICASVEPRTVTVAHELAHLFGAVHATDRGSIMYPIADFEARFFDGVNRRILRASRVRPLDEPLPAEMARELRAIYERAARTSPHIDPESLDAAARALP